MAVLSDSDFRTAIENDEGIIISNICEENITAAGYDLTIGFICDSDDGTIPEKDPKTGRYCLKQGKRYLVVSKEYVSLSGQYMATLHSRASYVLKGIIVPSTTIDPNFDGFLQSSLINASQNDVYIKENNQFLTMVIHTLATPTDTTLRTNEDTTPRSAQATLNAPFSNIDDKAALLVKEYIADAELIIRAKHNAAQNRSAKKIQEKQDSYTYSQMLEEQQKMTAQNIENIQTQMDAMQEQINKSEQMSTKDKKKKRWVILMQSVIIAVLLIIIFYHIWGESFWTFLIGIVPIVLAVPGFVADSGVIKEKINGRNGKE